MFHLSPCYSQPPKKTKQIKTLYQISRTLETPCENPKNQPLHHQIPTIHDSPTTPSWFPFLLTRAKYPKTAQSAATKFPSFNKILTTTPKISPVIFLPSTTRVLLGFPKKANSTTTVIHVTTTAGTITISAATMERRPKTVPRSTEA